MDNNWLNDYGALPIEDSDSCVESEQTISNSVSNAVSSLSAHGFAFFDPDLDPFSLRALSEINTTKFYNYETIVTLKDIDHKAEAITEMLLSEDNNLQLCQIVAQVIVKTVRAIFDASGDEACRFALRTHPPATDYTQYWHVDRSLAEISGIESDPNPIFIFALKGNGTLFYQTNSSLRAHWAEVNLEYPNDYGGAHTQYLFTNASNVYYTPPGHGSVHLSGYSVGTMHSPPNPDYSGRLVAIVSPGTLSLLQRIKQLQVDRIKYSKLST